MKWTLVVAFPILVALYSPISLLSFNAGDVDPSESYRSVVFLALISLSLLVSLAVLLGSLTKGSLLAATVLLVILSYGHIYNVLKPIGIAGVLIGRHRFLAPLSAGVILGASTWIWRRKEPLRDSVAFVGTAALALVLWSALAVVLHEISAERPPTLRQPAGAPTESYEPGQRGSTLDIYYIIVDGHGRADVLDSTYGYDSREFIEGLEELGFYVAPRSLSNYAWTALSLASSLNMTYLDDLRDALGPAGTDIGPARAMVADGVVFDWARRMGYEIAAYESGAPRVGPSKVDIYLRPTYTEAQEEYAVLGGLSLDPFEAMLLETSIGRVPFEWFVREQRGTRALITDFNYHKHRMRILFQLETLPEFASMNGDYFVFVHIMSPHPPFVFGANGEEVPNTGVYSTEDLGCCGKADYIQRYSDQVAFLDKMILQTVKSLIEASDDPPIIIIQGDHGPSANMDEGDSTEQGRFERMAILNAYLLPDRCRGELYPEISPVNTFRLILGRCLGSEVELLPERSYYSGYWAPYDFIPVADD